MENNFTKKYAPLIAKEIFKEIALCEKRLIKYRQKELENKMEYHSVRSQRHWKAAAAVDFSIDRINKLYLQLIDLDNQTGWSNNLNQDRFKFVEKYPDVIKNHKSNLKLKES